MEIQQWIKGFDLAKLQDSYNAEQDYKILILLREGKDVWLCAWGYPPTWQVPPPEKGGMLGWEQSSFHGCLAIISWKKRCWLLNWIETSWQKRNLRKDDAGSFSCIRNCTFVHQHDRFLCCCSYESVVLSQVFRSARQSWGTAFWNRNVSSVWPLLHRC